MRKSSTFSYRNRFSIEFLVKAFCALLVFCILPPFQVVFCSRFFRIEFHCEHFAGQWKRRLLHFCLLFCNDIECIRAVFVFFLCDVVVVVLHRMTSCPHVLRTTPIHDSEIFRVCMLCVVSNLNLSTETERNTKEEKKKCVTIKVVGKYNHGHLIECVFFYSLHIRIVRSFRERIP